MKRLRERARVRAAVRRFFDARDFVEVETPAIVPSPGLDLHLDAYEVGERDGRASRWLSTSPEYQMKRLLAEGYSHIYQLAPCFRRDESGTHHNPQFTMLEWYRASADVEDVIGDTEQLLAEVTRGEVRLGPRTLGVLPPIERLPVCEAFARFAGWTAERTLEAAANDEDSYFRAFVENVEPALDRLDRPVWLVDYPASQASLARLKPNDRRFADRFELYLGGVELCNGFVELVDPVEQQARLVSDQERRRARGLPVYPIDRRFLDALAHMPASVGNALGFDRLVALACGTTHIESVMAFTDAEL
jgi:elongation factor P--(R)-beta-lysine ligase